MTATNATGPAAGPDRSAGRLRVTVTHLELTATSRRPLPLRPPAERLMLLRAERPTTSFYRYLYETVGERWLWYERRLMSDDELAAVIRDPKVEIYVLYDGGVPAGFAELDRRAGSTVELRYMGLVPDFIGRGLGPFLLGCAVDAAFAGGAVTLTVNTNTLDHPKALAVYQRAGFVPVRQETIVIDDPRETGLIPRRG